MGAEILALGVILIDDPCVWQAATSLGTSPITTLVNMEGKGQA